MNDFFATYGLWLLIAILVVIVIVFLMSGKKGAAPPSVESPPIAPPAPDPVVAPEPEPVAPVTLSSGAAATVITPIPDSPAPAAAPAPIPVSPAATSIPDAPDNLLLLKGVGPKLAALLTELGVTRFSQIAAWTDADIAAVDARLGAFKGRPIRDQWIDQARYLAAGDTAGFEATYGKL